MSMVRLENVGKSFGSVEVLRDINLEIAPGELVVFVGPSGSGKSTLLRIIAGLEEATSGQISIEGRDVTFAEPSERGIAMVFQSYALYPHMDVYSNMAFNLQLSRFSKAEIRTRVEEAARILQLDDLLERSPAQLSGGQRQRVAIGRAIVRHPKVFLFDEPLSNLDAALRVQMRLEIDRLHRELEATMVYVTHDQVEAMTLADRIVALDGGIVQQVGRPLDLYHRPANRFVAEFVGSPRMNVLDVSVWGAVGNMPGETAFVGVRPEHLQVATGSNVTADNGASLVAQTRAVERLGNISYGYFETGQGHQLVAQIIGNTDLKSGDPVVLSSRFADMHLFAADGRTIMRRELTTPVELN
tara:strand:- start:17045 stop:18115 length:1071 start_codon:yes stop_codon:yes gene_type:complete